LWYCENLYSAARVGLTMMAAPVAAAPANTDRRVQFTAIFVPWSRPVPGRVILRPDCRAYQAVSPRETLPATTKA
jgi:hypothetical protein